MDALQSLHSKDCTSGWEEVRDAVGGYFFWRHYFRPEAEHNLSFPEWIRSTVSNSQPRYRQVFLDINFCPHCNLLFKQLQAGGSLSVGGPAASDRPEEPGYIY